VEPWWCGHRPVLKPTASQNSVCVIPRVASRGQSCTPLSRGLCCLRQAGLVSSHLQDEKQSSGGVSILPGSAEPLLPSAVCIHTLTGTSQVSWKALRNDYTCINTACLSWSERNLKQDQQTTYQTNPCDPQWASQHLLAHLTRAG